MSTENIENIPENAWERVAFETDNIITPANLIDGVALIGAAVSAPHLDSWPGIVTAALSYGADAIDGEVARRTNTASERGAKVDATGDKIKLAWAIRHIWNNDQAPKSLLTVVAARNLTNALITVADRTLNEKPQVDVDKVGKRAIGLEVLGIGLNVIGHKVGEKKPMLGRALRIGGTAIGFAGNVTLGYKATASYLDAFGNGSKKPWARKVLGIPLEPRFDLVELYNLAD